MVRHAIASFIQRRSGSAGRPRGTSVVGGLTSEVLDGCWPDDERLDQGTGRAQHHSRWSGENAVANHQRVVNVDQRAICGESGEQITTEIRGSAGDDEEPVGHERPQTLQTRQQGAAWTACRVDEHEYVARVTCERLLEGCHAAVEQHDWYGYRIGPWSAARGKPDPIFFGCSVVDGFSISPLKEPVMQERRDQGGDGDCDGGIKPGILADLGATR